MKILVVEDDRAIARGLMVNLELEGYEVAVASDGEEGLRIARAGGVDLIILDVMLPKLGGYEVCRHLRAEGVDTPIIMLTVKGREEERVLGFRLGADDYVVKPFSIMELMEGGKGDVPVHLSPKEFEVMRLLTERAGSTVSRKELLADVWGYKADIETRTVDAHIASLRRKLEDDPSEPRHILTVHGVGYKFVF